MTGTGGKDSGFLHRTVPERCTHAGCRQQWFLKQAIPTLRRMLERLAARPHANYRVTRGGWDDPNYARPTGAGSSGLSRLSGWSGWSDRTFIQKNQADQKDQPTRQTNSGALREQGDRPSYPVSFFSLLLKARAFFSSDQYLNRLVRTTHI